MKKNFSERCYEVLKKVPKGKVVTYKWIAEKLGSKAFRAVGNSMNKNPNILEVPCHRVVKSDGRVGGYAKGIKEKIKMLEKEGVIIVNGKIDLKKYCLK
ncbi:MAG: MGMT family protein [Candidatus Pacearchaeota archaeon]|jgi:methylated-DNA-[protein]-cysteine S-methyltransferase